MKTTRQNEAGDDGADGKERAGVRLRRVNSVITAAASSGRNKINQGSNS